MKYTFPFKLLMQNDEQRAIYLKNLLEAIGANLRSSRKDSQTDKCANIDVNHSHWIFTFFINIQNNIRHSIKKKLSINETQRNQYWSFLTMQQSIRIFPCVDEWSMIMLTSVRCQFAKVEITIHQTFIHHKYFLQQFLDMCWTNEQTL